MPKVSIIVPVFNVEMYLSACLRSLIEQTLKDIEIIVVNDGSTDGSLAIAQSFALLDPRIKVIDKPNAGYGHSMNRGIEAAEGDYIGIVESDDTARPNMFEFLYMQAIQNDAQIVRSNYFTMEGQESTFELVDVNGNAKAPYYTAIDPAEHPDILRGSPAIWTALYERSFIERNHLSFVESPGASYQDTGFFLKAFMSATRVVLVREAFLNYRIDNQQSSVKSTAKVFSVSDEYASVEEYMHSCPELLARRERFRYLLPAKKYETYLWNYNRLEGEARLGFLELMTREFKEADMQGELWNNLFTESEWSDLRLVVDDPAKLEGRDLVVDEHGASPQEYYLTKRANGLLPSWKFTAWKALQFEERVRTALLYRMGKYLGWGHRDKEAEREFLSHQENLAHHFNERSDEIKRVDSLADEKDDPSPMNKNPLVSVIIPVYNTAPYLQELMDSLRAQTYENLEFIFVDDGSTDESILLLEQFMYADPRVKVYPRMNSGVSVARNFGMKQAHGEYFCFVDSDDFVEPDLIECAVSTALEQQGDIVVFGMDEYSERTDTYDDIACTIEEFVPANVAFRGSSIPHLYKNIVGFTVNKLYRTAFIKQLGVEFPDLPAHEDLPFTYLALSAADRIIFVNRVLYHYRVARLESRSNQTNEHYSIMFAALDRLKTELLDKGLWEEYERIYLNYVLHMITWKWWSLPYARRLEFRDACRRTWLAHYGLLDFNPQYYFDPGEYKFLQDTKNMDFLRQSLARITRNAYRIQD